jgi:type I restriction enzyme R subunit
MFRKFSRMVQDIIDDFRAGRLSEAEYLTKAKEAREQLVSAAAGRGADVPQSVAGDRLRSAIFGQAADDLSEIAGDQADALAEVIALKFGEIINRHKRIGWTSDTNVENAMLKEMDDFLFDEIKGSRGLYGLDTDRIDQMLEAAMKIAKRQANL